MLLVVLVCMKFLLVPDGLGITYELHYNASPMPGALALVVGVLVALVAFILASGSLIGLMQGPRQQFRILFMGGYIVVVSAAVFLLLGIQHTSRKLTSPVPGLPTRLAAEGVEPRGPGSASGDLQRSFDFAADDDVDPLKRPDAPPTTAT